MNAYERCDEACPMRPSKGQRHLHGARDVCHAVRFVHFVAARSTCFFTLTVSEPARASDDAKQAAPCQGPPASALAKELKQEARHHCTATTEEQGSKASTGSYQHVHAGWRQLRRRSNPREQHPQQRLKSFCKAVGPCSSLQYFLVWVFASSAQATPYKDGGRKCKSRTRRFFPK